MGITMGDQGTISAGRDVVAGNVYDMTDDPEVTALLDELQQAITDVDKPATKTLFGQLVKLAPDVAKVLAASLPTVLEALL
jgi:uncharacterized NAD-dependent epimerase/dehydratase family protein